MNDDTWITQAFAQNIPDLARIIQDHLWIIQDITWIIQDLPWIIQDIAWIFQDHVWSCQQLFQNPSWTIQDHCQDHAGRGATQSDNSTPLHTNVPITTQPLPVLTLHFNTSMNNLQMTYCVGEWDGFWDFSGNTMGKSNISSWQTMCDTYYFSFFKSLGRKPAQIRDSGRPYTLSHTSYSWLEVQLTTQKQLQLV